MNTLIIHWLEKIAEDYNLDDTKNVHQKRAIDKAIFSMKQYDKEIKTLKDIKEFQKNIKGIGPKITDKIKIILDTGEYPLKHVTKNNGLISQQISPQQLMNKIKIASPLTALKQVTGIGDAKAKSLIEKGIFNIDMLKNAIANDEIDVTHHVQIGVKYYYDFNQRIPRDEIHIFKKCFDKIFSKLNLKYEICGSYRRGKETCGDMDILVTGPELKTDKDIKDINIMNTVIAALKSSKLLVEDGTLTPDAVKKFMGTCKLLNKGSLARRLDIRIIKYDSYSTALMYFTGSKEFNLRLRNKAIANDMLLNEYGLFKKNKERIDIFSEEDIFKILEEDYLDPTKR
jgi:DNA polymerase/3'-5' exonuclease PolX